MTTRVTQATQQRLLDQAIKDAQNRSLIYQNQVTSGVKVSKASEDPGSASTIVERNSALIEIEANKNRISNVKSLLTFEDDNLQQVLELTNRLKEISEQGANGTVDAATRNAMAQEVWQIRDSLVSLGNAKFQGNYINGGNDDDDPPFDASTYTVPSTGAASQRYIFDNEAGTSGTRNIKITEDLSISVNADGNGIYSTVIGDAERLGRYLTGYRTTPVDSSNAPTGLPDGGGTQMTFPQDASEQTQLLQKMVTEFETVRTGDIMAARIDLGGKLKRLENAETMLDGLKVNDQEVLDRLQSADLSAAASALSQAQTALQAAYAVSVRVLNNSILDYI